MILLISTGARPHNYGHYGKGSGPIFLSDVDCTGDETSLFNCTHDPGTGCEHADDVGVECGEELDDSDYFENIHIDTETYFSFSYSIMDVIWFFNRSG